MQLVDEDVSTFLLALKKETSLQTSQLISEYNAMHKYFIPIIPFHDFLSHIKRCIVYIFLSKVLPFFVSFRDHEKFKK